MWLGRSLLHSIPAVYDELSPTADSISIAPSSIAVDSREVLSRAVRAYSVLLSDSIPSNRSFDSEKSPTHACTIDLI